MAVLVLAGMPTDAETREFLASLIRSTRSLEIVYEPIAPGVVERRIPLN